MLYANGKDKKKISSFDAIKGEEYFCPACGGLVILKSGKTNIPHFSHKSLQECDIFKSDMSDWHINWQNKFPIECREKIVKHTFEQADRYTIGSGLEAEKEYIHRADVCINNYVIEFQHSTITKEDFMLRNHFYVKAGYNVIWIFDFRDEYASGRLDCYDSWTRGNDSGDKWKWNNPPRFLSEISPQRNKKIKIFIQFNDENEDNIGYIGLITWAMDSKTDMNLTDYRRFFTSHSISNYEELYDSIINNKI